MLFICDKCLKKKVKMFPKLYGQPFNMTTEIETGIVTEIYEGFIELNNKTLIAIDSIYKIEIVD